jgi:hypothetical protein
MVRENFRVSAALEAKRVKSEEAPTREPFSLDLEAVWLNAADDLD